MLSEVVREIERHATGDVGRPIAAIQPPGEVQPRDFQRACAVPSWNGRVEHERAGNGPRRRLEAQHGVELRYGTFERRVERGVDRDVPEAVEDAGPLLKLEPVGMNAEIEGRRRILAPNRTGQGERGRRRVHHEVVEHEAGRPVLEAAAEMIHRQVRVVPPPRDARERQPPSHGTVLECAADVQ